MLAFEIEFDARRFLTAGAPHRAMLIFTIGCGRGLGDEADDIHVNLGGVIAPDPDAP